MNLPQDGFYDWSSAAPDSTPERIVPPAALPDVPAESFGDVVVVVTVHNQARVVRPCLEALHARTPKETHVFIVDDASDEYTARMLDEVAERMRAERGGHVTVVHFEENQRYTRAINWGLTEVFSHGAKWGVCLNSDTMVTPGWLHHMLASAARVERCGMVCPYLSTVGDGSQHNPMQMHIPAGATYLETAERMATLRPSDPAAVVPVGACLMIREACWAQVGPFDEAVGALGGGYGEECDFWAKATQRGWRAIIATSAYVYHESHASYGAKAAEYEGAGYKAFIARHEAWYRARRDEAKAADPAPAIAGVIRKTRIANDRPQVAFYAEGIQLCGGILAPVNICNRLIERGIDARVAFSRDAGREWRLMPARFSPIVCDQGPAQWKRAGGFDRGIVVATDWRTGRFVRELAGQHRGILPCAFVQDREDWFRSKSGEPAFASPEAYRTYMEIARQRCVVNGQWVLDSMVRDHGLTPAASRRIGIGTDPDTFYDRGTRPQSGPVRVLAFSRPTTPRRGGALLALVYARLKARYGTGVELYTYGDTPDTDIPAHHIGKLPQSRLAIEMARHHVLLEPSQIQGWGMAAHEFMATGGTVVSTDNGGIREYAEHDVSALIADVRPDGSHDADSLFALACQAIDDATPRARLGAAARKAACAYSWDAIADQWAAQIREWWARHYG